MNLIAITGKAGAGKDTAAQHIVKKYGYTRVALADPIKRFVMKVFGFSYEQLWGDSHNRDVLDPRYTMCEILSSGGKLSKGSRNSLARTCDPAWASAGRNLLKHGEAWLEEIGVENGFKSLCFWFCSLGHHYPQISPRIVLQSLGTELGRETLNPDVWVEYLLGVAKSLEDSRKTYTAKDGIISKEEETNGVVVPDVRFLNELDLIHKFNGRVLKLVNEDVKKEVGIPNHASETEQILFDVAKVDSIIKNNGTVKELQGNLDVMMIGWGL